MVYNDETRYWYAATADLKHQNIENHAERISKIKPFYK